MPLKTTLADVENNQIALQNNIMGYIQNSGGMSSSTASMLNSVGLDPLAAPGMQKQVQRGINMEQENPDWFIKDQEELKFNIGTGARLAGQFAYNLVKGIGGMAQGTLSPTDAREMRYLQIKDLIQQHMNAKDPATARELEAQMQSLSPYLTDKYLAQVSSAAQFVPMVIAPASKLFNTIKALQGIKTAAAVNEAGVMAEQILNQAGKGVAKKGILGLTELGIKPDQLVKASELAMEPWVQGATISLAAKNVDDIRSGNAKNVIINFANDPTGFIATAGLGMRALLVGAKYGGKFRKKGVDNIDSRANEAAQVMADSAASDISDTYNTNTFSNLEGLRKIVSEEHGPSIVPDGMDNTNQKLHETIQYTKNDSTLKELQRLKSDPGIKDIYNQALNGDIEAKAKVQTFTADPEVKRIFDDSQGSFNDGMNEVGKKVQAFADENMYTKTYLDKYGADRVSTFTNGLKDVLDKYKNNEINMTFKDFSDTLARVTDDAADYITGRGKNIGDVFDPFLNKTAKDMSDIQSHVENKIEPATEPADTTTEETAMRLNDIGFTDEQSASMDTLEKMRVTQAYKTARARLLQQKVKDYKSTNWIDAREAELKDNIKEAQGNGYFKGNPKDKMAEIPFGKTKEEMMIEASKVAQEMQNNSKDINIGFSVADLNKYMNPAIEAVFFKHAAELSKMPRSVRNLMKKAMAEFITDMADKTHDPIKFVENLTKLAEDVYDNKVKLFGLDKDALIKVHEALKAGTVNQKDIATIFRIAMEYDIDPKSPIRNGMNVNEKLKMAGLRELPAVFKVINEIYEQIYTNKEGNGNHYAKVISAERMNAKIDGIKEFGNDLKDSFKRTFETWKKEYEKELTTKAEGFKKSLDDKYMLSWGTNPAERKIYNFRKKEDFMSFMKELVQMKDKRKEGDLEKALIDDLGDSIEKITTADPGMLQIKKFSHTQIEVFSDLGLDVIDKIQNGIALHIKPLVDMDKTEIHGMIKNIKLLEKHGKMTDRMKIRDVIEGYVDSDQSGLQLHERNFVRKLQGILKRWDQYKQIFPDYVSVKNYMHRRMLDPYFKTEYALKTDIIEKFQSGMEEARKALDEVNRNEEQAMKDIKNSRSMGAQEKDNKVSKYLEYRKGVEERYKFYTDNQEEFVNTIKQQLHDMSDAGEIDPDTFSKAMKDVEDYNEIRGSYPAMDGGMPHVLAGQGTTIAKVLMKSDRTPSYVKYRLEAGLEPMNDMINHYAAKILEDGGFPMYKIKSLPPIALLHIALKKFKAVRQMPQIPAYFDKGTMTDWIKQLTAGYGGEKMNAPRLSAMNEIFGYDRMVNNSKDILPYMSEKKIDTSIIDRVTSNLMYKAEDPFKEVSMYLDKTVDGLSSVPVAKILNALKDYIDGNPEAKIKGASKEVAAYFETSIIDLTGRNGALDGALQWLILSNKFKLFSEPLVKFFARKNGIQDPVIGMVGDKMMVHGKSFEMANMGVGDITIEAEALIPKRIATNIVNKFKMINYMALLGLSPRSALVNLTQTLTAMSYEQDSGMGGLAPKLNTYKVAFTAYQRAMSELCNPKEFLKLRRAGVLADAYRMNNDIFGNSSLVNKMVNAVMFNMTSSEYLNRVAIYEYFKELHKDTFKAMDLNESEISVLAKDFSDKYNFKFDALNQPQFLRTLGGKIVGHLGTFSYDQIKLFAGGISDMLKSLPTLKETAKKTFHKLGSGDWEGFKAGLDQLNNQQRFGVLRYVGSSYMVAGMMYALFGYSLSSMIWNRQLSFPGANNPLVSSFVDFAAAITGDKPFAPTIKGVVMNFVPLSGAMRKFGQAMQNNDVRYLIANSRELGLSINPKS